MLKHILLSICLFTLLLCSACATQEPPPENTPPVEAEKQEIAETEESLSDGRLGLKDSYSVVLAEREYLEGDLLCYDVTISKDYTNYNIEGMFYVFGQDSFNSFLYEPKTEDLRLRILTETETLYQFLYSAFNPFTGAANANPDLEDEQPYYLWFAQQWPMGEYPFSFFCKHEGIEPEENWLTQLPIRHIPQIARREAFCHKDIVELRQSLGFSLGDCLNLVNDLYQGPRYAEAIYWDGIPSFELNAYYSFGHAYSTVNYWIDEIVLTDSSATGPRGLKVGDSYQKVLESFPLANEPAYESGIEEQILYQLDYDLVWEDYYDTVWGGKLIYDTDGRVAAIEYSYTFPRELYEESVVGYDQHGYDLRFAISDEQITEISVRAIIQYI